MNSELNKFLKKSLIFFPLILILVILPTLCLWRAGEFVDIDDVIRQQLSDHRSIMFSRAYNGQLGYLKLRTIQERRPQIIALGSSRTMQFRSKFFKPSVFYNAGGGARIPEHFEEFLKRIPQGREPKVMIIGLDHIFFNPRWSAHDELMDFKKFYSKTNIQEIWITGRTRIIQDYLSGKFTLRELLAKPQNAQTKIGLLALIDNSGIINDGSHYYGKFISNPQGDEDYGSKATLGKIAVGARHYEYSDAISAEAIEAVQRFLDDCKERGITVIGFLPPFTHTVYEALTERQEHYPYIFDIYNILKPIFDEKGFGLYDFTDLAILGADDEESFDGSHGSEKAYARLIIRLLEKEPILRQYADANALKARIKNIENPYVIFSNDEF